MFFGSQEQSRARRRGVVLILILGMLALMALIGVTFATFAGQALVNNRNFSQSVNFPTSEQLMDYGLAQLINDTNNPLSAMRGHSLLRDMYGNDSLMTGNSGAFNAQLTALPGGTPLQILNSRLYVPWETPPPNDFTGCLQVGTNIPVTSIIPALFNVNFTRWTFRVPGGVVGNPTVGTTYEVVDDDIGLSGFAAVNGIPCHTLTLVSVEPFTPTGDGTLASDTSGLQPTRLFPPQTIAPLTELPSGVTLPVGLMSPHQAALLPSGSQFVLDGRYARAFNGSGWSSLNPAGVPFNTAAYANFRTNGSLIGQINPATGTYVPYSNTGITLAFGNPDLLGSDEDYDACDLENWFLALQSADGAVMIPSFHRPGILTGQDWQNTIKINGVAATVMSVSKILRPRSIDNSTGFPADPIPNALTGKISYDVDNDGDGINDSVWLDLGYPILRDPRGLNFKPLFAFMVLGLNGRMPLNTVGNLHSRDFQRITYNNVPGVNQVATLTPNSPFNVDYFPQTYLDGATWSHASHLGFSVNEINPMFALQNAPNKAYNADPYNLTGAGFGPASQFYGQFDDSGVNRLAAGGPFFGNGYYDGNANTMGNAYNPVLGNAVPGFNQLGVADLGSGVGIDTVQLRNILAGTIPQGPLPPTALSGTNPDINSVLVNGKKWFVPNSMLDAAEGGTTAAPILRLGTPVPGRWGEPNGIPNFLSVIPVGDAKSNALIGPKFTPNTNFTIYSPIYTNPVRAGRSVVTNLNLIVPPLSFLNSVDAMDDDLDAYDPHNSQGGAAGETFDYYDAASGLMLPSERIRRFINPIDPVGVGRVVAWNDSPPRNFYDYGTGYDEYGRVAFFRHFRPPGLPRVVSYDIAQLNPLNTTNYPATATAPFGGSLSTQLQAQFAFNQPILTPPNVNPNPYNSLAGTQPNPSNVQYDTTSNRYHGYQSSAAPVLGILGGAEDNTTTNTTTNPVTSTLRYGPQTAPPALPVSDAGVAVASAMPYDFGMATPPPPATPTTVIAPPSYVGTTPYDPNFGLTAASLFPTLIDPNSTVPYQNATFFTMTPSPVATFQGVNSGQGPLLANPDSINNNALSRGTAPLPNPGAPSIVNGYPSYPPIMNVFTGGTNLTVAMPGGSLTKDEADEMNLYANNYSDMPYGPSDIEWLYRLQDVDGASLSSRLGQLAPVSFLNPADQLTRRRLFSTDSWDSNTFAYAPDQPLGNQTIDFDYYGTSPLVQIYNGQDWSWNSRFNPGVSANLQYTNFNASYTTQSFPNIPFNGGLLATQNRNAIQFLPNPLSYPQSLNPLLVWNPTAGPYSFSGGFLTPTVNTTYTSNGITLSAAPGNAAPSLLPPVIHGAVASRGRKINLNLPLPVSNDTAEPVRQKWIRETYDLFKSVLPPQAIDTPDELAALSQYVVNIIDFRDPDCTTTRFVNTDLMIRPATTSTTQILQFADRPIPISTNNQFFHFPFDPTIYEEQMLQWSPNTTLQTDWSNGMIPLGSTTGPPYMEYLVQHGMEYNPLAINEVLAYQYDYYPLIGNPSMPSPPPVIPFNRFAFELVNMLTDDGTTGTNAPSSSDMNAAALDGWDVIVADDTFAFSRPDPITGEIHPSALAYQNLVLTNQPKNPGQKAVQQAVFTSTPGTPLATPPPFASSYPPATAQPNIPGPLNPWTGLSYGIFLNPGCTRVTPSIPATTNIPAMRTNSTQGTQGNFFFVVGTDESNFVYPNPYGTFTTTIAAGGTSANPVPLGGTPMFYQENPVFPNSIASAGVLQYEDALMPPGILPTLTPGFPPTGQKGNTYFYWLHLRRPANPFDQRPYAYREMVTVDSIRFPYSYADNANPNGGKFAAPPPASPAQYADRPPQGGSQGRFSGGTLTGQNTIPLFSVKRRQPYRGGQQIPPYVIGGTPTDTTDLNAYGYSEQTANYNPGLLNTTTANPTFMMAYFSPNNYNNTLNGGSLASSQSFPIIGFNAAGGIGPAANYPQIQHTIGFQNRGDDAPWDHFPFNDRDFSSVAELLLVPGCPPGLFTKQFVELNNPAGAVSSPTLPFVSSITLDKQALPAKVLGAQPWSTQLNGNTPPGGPPFLLGPNYPKNTGAFSTTAANGPESPNTYPYLVDRFYYSAVSPVPLYNGLGNTAFTASTSPNQTTYPVKIGGFTADGWHRLLEFVEVPSSANGAIGTVAAGENFDWFRQDRKPGLINLNLIIDEEVFFGLLDDPRLNRRLFNNAVPAGSNTYIPYPSLVGQLGSSPVFINSLPNATSLPLIVTQIAPNGYPTAWSSIGDVQTQVLNNLTTPVSTASYHLGRGHTYFDEFGNETHGMKAAFADFLKLRAGGSGFLFAWGMGATGSGSAPLGLYNAATNPTPVVPMPPLPNDPVGTSTPTLGPSVTFPTLPNTALTLSFANFPLPGNQYPGTSLYTSGTFPTQIYPVAQERPFRSLSYPDINFTVMRPATLPPSNLTYPPITWPPVYTEVPSPPNPNAPSSPPTGYPRVYYYTDATGAIPLAYDMTQVPPVATNTYVMDPGVRFPSHTGAKTPFSQAVQTGTFQVEPVPVRRLFQIPDIANGSAPPANASLTPPYAPLWGGATPPPNSNAAEFTFLLNTAAVYPMSPVTPALGNPDGQPIYHEQLSNPSANLFAAITPIVPPGAPALIPNFVSVQNYLGAGQNVNLLGSGQSIYNPPPATNSNNNPNGVDFRQHPLYRTELLQKVMNLTTVRTHQFAVWITVGFFEVTQPGTPALGVPDVLGQEWGLLAGKNIRFRSFFLLDRTLATGFNTSSPIDFRNVVTYRRRIE